MLEGGTPRKAKQMEVKVVFLHAAKLRVPYVVRSIHPGGEHSLGAEEADLQVPPCP